MKLQLLSFFLAFFIIGCSDKSDIPQTKNDSSKSADTVEFEIRDFKQEKSSGRYSSFQGRGTVIVKDRSLQTESVQLVLKETETPSTGETSTRDVVVYLTDGVGTIETSSFIGEAEKNILPPKYKWEAVGWSKLKSAKVIRN